MAPGTRSHRSTTSLRSASAKTRTTEKTVPETQSRTADCGRTTSANPVTTIDNMARETQSRTTTSVRSPSSRPSMNVENSNGSQTNIEQSPTDQSTGPTGSDGSIPPMKTRGVTRGLGIDRIVASTGGLPITITPGVGKPICDNASKLANECGCIVREFAPKKVESWTKIEPSERTALFHHLLNKFVIDLSLPHVIRYLDHTMGRKFSNHRNTLHKEFKKYEKVEQAKQHPYRNVSKEDWDWLCDLFDSKDFKERSKKNSENRSKLEFNHRAGSSSFLRHAEKKRKSTGEEPSRIELFYSTHYSTKNGWANAEAESKYNQMLDLQQENESEETTPRTQDEICEIVLGKKSGYVKGLGYGPRPKIFKSSTTSDAAEKERLLEIIKDQADHMQSQADHIQSQEERLKRLEEIILNSNSGILPESNMPSYTTTGQN